MVTASIEEALEAGRDAARDSDTDEIMVIGGGEIYRAALPLADRIYLTEVHNTIDGDTLFPTLEKEVWQEVERSQVQVDEKSGTKFSWVILDRK